MKKIISVFLAAAAIITMAASCSDSKTTSTPGNEASNSESNAESSKEEISQSESSSESSSGAVNLDRELLYDIKMYVDLMYGRRTKLYDDSYVFRFGDEDVIILKYLGDDFTGTNKDILPYLNTGKMWKEVDEHLDVSMPEDKDFFLTVDSETDADVNGKQCRKITGSVTDEEGTKVLAYGYTFIYENIPFMMMGYVLEECQAEKMPRVMDEVDAMTANLRPR